MALSRFALIGIGLAGVLFAGSTGFGLSQSLNWNKELVERRVLADFVGPVLPPPQKGVIISLRNGEALNSGALNRDAFLIGAPGIECLEPGAQFLPVCADVSVEMVQKLPQSTALSSPLEVQVATLQAQSDGPPAVAPVPAPLSHRPILVVYPASSELIRVARSVSGDPLVHDDAPGSWPRRLDQVNALAGAEQIIWARHASTNIFLRNWVETRRGIRIAGVSP